MGHARSFFLGVTVPCVRAWGRGRLRGKNGKTLVTWLVT
ncbi:hypothetical protein BRPE64_BCDS04130 [Caballeronia insecticola]|uniref:Uncharacterized protein n=1 Tax=Caballeronia insecticola TaxID=758793 RepID=R4WKU2_9BURK|nr:hypothetical protein BRPE64_BCDS04130 [Caballeronia insecticola]